MIIDSPKDTHHDDVTKFVNHELSVDLDSSNAFEGPEKLLEIWFAPDKELVPSSGSIEGLRSVPRAEWEEMLDIVKCKVLSTLSSPEMDAYLLSESSMFVFPHKLILKTCGTTTTLIGIPKILELAAQYAGFTDKQPWRVFYSRKAFMFPEMQLHPHGSWDDEVKYLNGVFDNGGSYLVGNLSADHWHLFTTDPAFEHVPTHVDCAFQDETMEVLMTHLSPQHAAQFFTNRLPGAEKFHRETDYCGDDSVSISSGSTEASNDPGHDLGSLVTKYAKIDKIYPGVAQSIDSFGFTPCGYSCNAIVNNDHYFTIHVTPEAQCSYASFETNVPAAKYGMTNLEVLARVVNIFRPGRFSLTLFEATGSPKKGGLPKKTAGIDGYKRTDRILYEFDGYDLVFVSFEAI